MAKGKIIPIENVNNNNHNNFPSLFTDVCSRGLFIPDMNSSNELSRTSTQKSTTFRLFSLLLFPSNSLSLFYNFLFIFLCLSFFISYILRFDLVYYNDSPFFILSKLLQILYTNNSFSFINYKRRKKIVFKIYMRK